MIASLLDLTGGLLLVLLLRRPVRRLLGAGPAFTLWLWPPLLALAPFTPLPMIAPAWPGLTPVLVAARDTAHALAGTHPARLALWSALWTGGATAALLRLAIVYLRLRRGCRAPSPALRDAARTAAPALDPRRLRMHGQGPAVLWAPRSLVLLPPDFADDGDPHRQRLVLSHEQSHLQRLDPLWLLLAEIVTALLWFHPLAWLALPRFRLDQELACDERTLRQRGTDATSYARVLLSSAGAEPSPALIPWLAEPQLKERLTMILRSRTRTPLRVAGTLGLSLAGAGLALAVRTVPPGQFPAGASQDLAFNVRVQPRYPSASITNKEQGLVMLKVLVDADGSVKRVDYDPMVSTTTSARLIAAASDAARHWRFSPATRDGRPVESYARVPVQFSIDALPDRTRQPETQKKASEYSKKY